MIIPKKNRLSADELTEVTEIVEDFGCRLQEIVGEHRCVYAILGDERKELMFNRLLGLEYVDRVDHIESPFRLLDRSSELASHPQTVGGITVGEQPLWIAGPCTVDPDEPSLTIETAHALKEAGATVLRGGVWKPRTMPYSYQGDTRALEVLLEARRTTGLPLNVEVMDREQLEIALDAGVEMLQVGTRNSLNYSLLKDIGRKTAGGKTHVLLKRGRHMAPVDEFIAAAEYIVMGGNPRILLCPRGTAPALDGYRNHPDESITPLLKDKTWAPVVVDPSHSVGKAVYVPACVLAALAYGADGICLEAHVDPRRGIGDDPKQAVSIPVLEKLMRSAAELWKLRNTTNP